MRNTFKTIALLAVLFTTVMVSAKDLNITADSTEQSLVFEMEAAKQSTTIRIMDSRLQEIYGDVIAAGTPYFKKFDVSNLISGNYTVSIEDSLKRINYSVTIDGDTLEISKPKRTNKPVFRKKGDRIYVNLLNLDLEDIAIAVYDSEGRRLFSETNNADQIVQKAFNFEDAKNDSYTVMVRDASHTYYEEIVVK
ncbi:hypothetical protein [Maribacter sp. 2-571]|uniref:hypothetical protein n=1 Tax=Maribacter sp. 2-571 TaxID=3417569 RepID=UPI003D32A18F